jgi:hypothetical protein
MQEQPMHNKDTLVGLLFVALSVVFGITAFHYNLGSLSDPGPGLFPLGVSICLFTLGLINIFRGFLSNAEFIEIELYNISLITISLLAFTVATTFINMLAGIIMLVTVSSLSVPDHSIARNIKLILGLISVALGFKYLLGLNLPLF